MNRSKISQLPEAIRLELDRRLIAYAFSNYRELADWLTSQGCEISHTAVHKYGQKFAAQLEDLKTSAEQARAIIDTIGDEENALGEAVTNLALQKALIALQHIDPESAQEDPRFAYDWTKVLSAIGKLSSQSIANKQYRSKVQKQIEVELQAIEKESKTESETVQAATLAALERVRKIHGIY